MSELLAGADISGLPQRGKVVVGFSGGADSTALAHWLLGRLGPERLVLAHVNHQLRGEESDRDEAAAHAFAKRFGLDFALRREDVAALARRRGLGLEECGRQVRYGFFQSLAPGEADRILTAHNANDNAETVLMHLCRGTSLPGLLGIPARRGKVLRPLLRVPRGEIEAYCQAHGLPYVTDSSNLSREYTRNRLRLEVLPVLEELNPSFLEAVARMTDTLSQDSACLEAQAQALLEACRGPWGLDAAKLRQMGDLLRDKAPNVVGVLATVNGEKITFLAVCGKEAVAKGIKAGDIIKTVTAICGGKGGGKPDSAMGGGSDVVKLDNALAAVDDFVSQKLGL